MIVQRRIQGLVLALVAIGVVVLGLRGLVYLTGTESMIGPVTDGPRGACPQTDNCVSSFATEAPWAIEPLACTAPEEVRLAIAHQAVLAQGDVEVVTEGRAYVVRSMVMRFPDDVRFVPSERGLEVISASRLGAGDLGVNRARVESMRTVVEGDPRC